MECPPRSLTLPVLICALTRAPHIRAFALDTKDFLYGNPRNVFQEPSSPKQNQQPSGKLNSHMPKDV
jgi:hypothetical protein